MCIIALTRRGRDSPWRLWYGGTVQVFDVSGEEVTSFDVDPASHDADITALAFRAADDTLFVADGRARRVLAFSFSDAATYSGPALKCPAVTTNALGSPAGLAVSGTTLFVSDTDNDTIHVFEENPTTGSWKWQRSLGSSGARAGTFSSPEGLALTR